MADGMSTAQLRLRRPTKMPDMTIPTPVSSKASPSAAIAENAKASNFLRQIIETDLELIENAFATKDIKSNSEALRESNWRRDFKFTNVEWKIVEIGRNVTAIPDDNHLQTAFLTAILGENTARFFSR